MTATWLQSLGCSLLGLNALLVVATPALRAEPATGPDSMTQEGSPAIVVPSDAPTIAALPDGPPDPTPTRGMTETLDIDLKADPRKDLQVDGPVAWQPGQLTIGPAGSISRGLDLGSQAQLSLRLKFPPLKEDGQTSTTLFAFQLRDRGEFVVRMHRQRQGGETAARLQLIEKETPFGQEKVTRTLRTEVWKGDFPDGVWTFRHHDGLLMVSAGGKRLAVGFADKEPTHPLESVRFEDPVPARCRMFYYHFGICEPLEVSGWSLEQQGTPVACLEVAGTASPSYRKTMAPASSFNRTLAKYEKALGTRDIASYSCDNILRLRINLPGDREQEQIENRRRLEDESPVNHIRECLGESHPDYALALAGIGLQYHWAGKDKEATDLLTKATRISAESLGPLHPDHALIVSALGRLHRAAGQFDAAEPLLTQASQSALALFGARSARYLLAERELAMLYQDTGRMAAAETTLRRAAESCQNALASDREEALPVLVSLGELEVRLGEREKSVALLRQADEAMDRLLFQEGDVRRPGESEASYEARRRLLKLLPVDLAKAKVLLGWESFHHGQKREARKLAREAYLYLAQFFGPGGTPASFGGLGNRWDSRIQNAGPDLRMVYHPEYGRVLIALAELFAALGDIYPAISCVEVTDALSGSQSQDLGVLCRTMATLTEADPNLQTGIVASAGMSERKRLEVVYQSQSGPAQRGARLPPQKVARRPPEPGGRRLPPDVYWRQLALEKFEATDGRDHPDTLDTLRNIARRRWSEAGPVAAEAGLRDTWSRAVDLSEQVLSGLPEVQAYQFLEINGPPADLLLSCYRATRKDRAREAYEVVWRGKALATRLVVERRQLVQAASEKPEIAKLAEDLQATRQQLAWLSLSVPSGNAAQSRLQQLADLTGRKEDLERQLAGQSESFRRARESRRTSVADLAHALPADTAVVDFVERWEWTPPASKKPSEAWGRTRCYDAFVLRSTPGDPGWSVAWLALGDADALDRLLDDWMAGLRRQGPIDTRVAVALRRQLLEPIEGSLEGCKRLVLIPDGRLAQAPFAALPGRRPNTYLLEDYALAQAPYGQSVARLLTEPALESQGFLLVGGVDYGPQGKWKNLAGTTAEVERLAQLRPGPQTVRLGGPQATKSRLRELLPGRRYVHLATHGEFLDTSPKPDGDLLVTDSAAGGVVLDVTIRNPLLLSLLVLAGANQPAETDEHGLPVGSDSFLTAEEVMGMDLGRNELVVLSACETGAGKVRNGEGVFSLQRAFHVGGSRTVVATLWSISDGLPTQLVMERFYRNLWEKKMGKLEALREAQLWLLREGRTQPTLQRGFGRENAPPPDDDGRLPPYYWAAFVLSGDWR